MTAAGPQTARPPGEPAFAVEPNPIFAPFTPGNIVVYRIGPIGGGALSSAATAVFIDEYTTSGVHVRTSALPTTDSGIHQTLTAAGASQQLEGLLTLSTDGHYLLLNGYDAAVGTPDVEATPAAAVNRVVGRIAADGTVDTSTALSDFASTHSPRGVASTNGTDIWVAGGGDGVRYTTIGSTTSTRITSVTNLRGVEIFDGQLYVSSIASTFGSSFRLASVGIGVPTTPGQTMTNLNGIPGNAGISSYQFFFADLTASVAGLDTLYVSDEVNGLLKYSLVAGTWTLNGTVGVNADDYVGLTGSVSGTTTTLYATRLNGSSADQIVSLIDTGGYNAAFSITTPTVIATASANTAFRGIAFAPSPGETQTVTFNPTSVIKYEGHSGTTVYTFTVTRGGGTTGQLDFSGTIALGTTDAADYVGGVAPTVFNGSILAGQASATVTVNIQGDLTIESGESFTLTLTNVSNGAAGVTAAIGVNHVATGTITDDDAPGTLSINDVSIYEGNSGTSLFTFTVTRSGIGGAITADWTISAPGGAGNANAADFVAGSVFAGQLAFADGESTKTISIGVQGDTVFEPTEAFTVTLSNATGGAGIGDGTGAGIIVNDDLSTAGTPATIDFNPLLIPYGAPYPHPDHYFEHGLHFSAYSTGFVIVNQGPGGPALVNRETSGIDSPIIYIRPMIADPFSIVSIDLDGLYRHSPGGNAITFNFTAMTVDGQTRTASFTTDATIGLQTYSFPPGFVGLMELRWTLSGVSPVGLFDNVVINATQAHSFVGTDSSDVMAGTDADDVFLLGGEGAYIRGSKDTVRGRGGNDLFYFGESFLNDYVDGGEGEDRLLLQGNYYYPLALSPSMTGIETVVLLSGSDTSYGDVAGNSYVYNLDAHQGVVGAGQLLTIDGSALRAGETFTFDGVGVQGGGFALTGGDADDVLVAGSGSDSLNGGGGSDLLDGGRGVDVMAGGAGDDIFKVDNLGDTVLEAVGQGNDRVFTSVSYTLAAGAEVERLSTDSNTGLAAINLTGNALAQGIYGNMGANQLRGGGGADSLAGFEGTDWYFITDGREVVFESAGGGNDRIFASVDYRLQAGAEVELMTTDSEAGTAAIDLTGNELDNLIYGNAGDNRLDGGTGADRLIGLAGNDWYYIDNANDQVVEAAGEGNDRVFASVSYTLTAGVDVELLTTDFHAGTAAIDLTGNALANIIYGNAGDNRLNGAAGADTLVGLAGNDWFFVDNAGDRIVETAGEGSDRVFASVSYTLSAGAEVEMLTTGSDFGTAAINLTGNALAQGIYGNAGANQLSGGGGADSLVGFGGDDWYFITDGRERVFESAGGGHDRVFAGVSYTLGAGVEIEIMSTDFHAGTAAINLTGNALDQDIYGNAGANTLRGGGGADTMVGFAGDDIYYLDNYLDQVRETAGEGNDRVFASGSYVLQARASIELLSTDFHAGTSAINLYGNELANTIYGNDGDNELQGRDGADILIGRAGDDLLFGGTGIDTTNGGLGDDVHYVDEAADLVQEAIGEGTDRVWASVSYTLAAGAEVELLTTNFNGGTSAINLTGNAFAQALYGNAGANSLNGRGGADTMVGFGGDDFYYVDNGGDRALEDAGEGNDRVFASISFVLAAGASIELLTTDFHAGTTAINLTGNELANAIFGNDGANTLSGGGGADNLVGWAGNDVLIGGAGIDATNGGTGDDWHYVDDSADLVREAAGEGSDRVLTSVSYTLAAGVAVELFTTDSNAGTSAINLTGNEVANTIYGNDGANILDGKGGSDVLIGRLGGDTFAFTTALGAGNVDSVLDFVPGTDLFALDDAVFTAIGRLGALNNNAFVTGTAAADADDRIIYNSATGALLYDADGNGAGTAVQFATLDTGLALLAIDFMVI